MARIQVIIDINHLAMSAAMVLMIGVAAYDAVAWAQVVIFATIALALLLGVLRASEASRRISLVGHVVLNAAMIWMLLRRPLLMPGMASADDNTTGHHHSAGTMVMPMSTPEWADVLNGIFVALSAAAAMWWVVTPIRRRGRHLHDICYAGMAAGMAAMLGVRNELVTTDR